MKLLRQYDKEKLKTVVFSQFTSFLDIIGEALDYESIHFTRLDGSHSQPQREKVLSTFATSGKKGANVLLISLRAGGVGLNLTCANRVIMMVKKNLIIYGMLTRQILGSLVEFRNRVTGYRSCSSSWPTERSDSDQVYR